MTARLHQIGTFGAATVGRGRLSDLGVVQIIAVPSPQ